MTVAAESTPIAQPHAAPPSPKPVGNGLVRPSRGGVRFTTDQYLRMDRAGLFDDTKVELVLGRIYPMNAQADSHMWAISKGSRKLQQLFPPETYWVIIQGTLLLRPKGAPEPDFHVFDVPEGMNKDGRPPILLVEVSDSTYRHDSGVKVRQYALAGITDYWIVNVQERRIEVYRRPESKAGKNGEWGYAEVTQHTSGMSIALLNRPDVSIAVNDLLP